VFEEIQTPCNNLAPAPPSEMILTSGYTRVEVVQMRQNIVLQVIQVEPTASCRLLHRALQFVPSCCRPSTEILVNHVGAWYDIQQPLRRHSIMSFASPKSNSFCIVGFIF
jgi:hypothetical protein